MKNLLLGILGLTAAAEFSPASGQHPNIIFILADDLGWTDLGCQGSKFYETPNIDKLAAQGLRMTCFYNCQNCTPTRAAIMSGQYPARTGVFTVGSLERGLAKDRKLIVPINQTQLPLDRQTIAQPLQAAGYVTGMFGKWHIGETGNHHPGKRGFDEAIVSMGKHFNFATKPPVDIPPGVYLADWLTDKALDFIQRHRQKPFFLYLPHFAVHSPFHAKKDMIARFAGKTPVGGHHDPTYAAMIASLDESVGRILAKLEELKLADHTIVIFSSDNGGVGGYQEIGGKGITSNAPLRGGKGMLYCGGLRVPFIVRWPGHTKPGSTNDTPALHVDLFPTFLEIARVKQKPSQVLDGESMASLWRDPAARLARQAIFFHFPGYLEGFGSGKWRTAPVGAIQAGDWKLMEFFETGKLELYNLREDLGEKNNLAEKMPDRSRQLHAQLQAWRQEVKAAMPRLPGPNESTGGDGKKGQKKKGAA